MPKDCIVVHYKLSNELEVYRIYACPAKAGNLEQAKLLCCQDVQKHTLLPAHEIHAEIRILWEIDQ